MEFKNAEALSRCFPQNIISSPTPKPGLAQIPSSFETTNPETEKTFFFLSFMYPTTTLFILQANS